MRINTIHTGGADITIDTSELICLANVLYFYEKHWRCSAGHVLPGCSWAGGLSRLSCSASRFASFPPGWMASS